MYRLVFSVFVLSLWAGSAAEAALHLAFDICDLNHSTHVHIALGPVRKEAANPLFGESQPWDAAWWNTYPSVVWDEKEHIFKAWYNANVDCGTQASLMCPNTAYKFNVSMATQTASRRSATLYAESADGLSWKRPALGLVPWGRDGSTANNIVLDSGGVDPNRGVFLDPSETDPSRRFKMIGSVDRSLPATPGASFATFASEDGRNWSHFVGADEVHAPADTANNALWDGSLGRYLIFTRTKCYSAACNESAWGLRREARSISKTGVWAPHTNASGNWMVAQEVAHGESGYELYSLVPMRRSNWRAGLLLGIGSFYATTDPQQRVYCELMMSGDHGETWSRVAPHQPIIPLGEAGAFDDHTCYAAPPISDPHNDTQLLLYYAGGNGPHSGARADFIALARAGVDTLAGISATYTGAGAGSGGSVFVTRPLPELRDATSVRVLARGRVRCVGGSTPAWSTSSPQAHDSPEWIDLEIPPQQRRAHDGISDDSRSANEGGYPRLKLELSHDAHIFALKFGH